MPRILLLDCSESLCTKLAFQGFDVEAGTVGFSTGTRRLPSQVYEKDVVFYNPESMPGDNTARSEGTIRNLTPQFDLRYLKERIQAGATFVCFLNRFVDNIGVLRTFYDWIPFIPAIEATSDKLVHGNTFAAYPYNEAAYLAPIVTPSGLKLPVRVRIIPPEPQLYLCDVFPLFSNHHGQCLGVQMLRGKGRVIFLPNYNSNEEVVDDFLNRVVPRIYGSSSKSTFADAYRSTAENAKSQELEQLTKSEADIRNRLAAVRGELAAASREKLSLIDADSTAKLILVYHEYAKRQDDAALYYLYKIVEAIENQLGGEAQGITQLGAGTEWKAVKKLANESYRDARHAPKPGDIVHKWAKDELKKCFADVETIVNAYFRTLVP